MEKKFKLKKLLATASAFAVIAGASSSAMGGPAIQMGNAGNAANVILGIGANSLNVAGGPSAFTDGASLYFDQAALDLTTSTPVIIGSIDLNNKAPGTFTVNHNSTVGSVGDSVGAGNKMDIIVGNGVKLTLSSDFVQPTTHIIHNEVYTGLGNIVLGTGGAGGSDLDISGQATLAGTINSGAIINGVINVGKAATETKVLFTGILGAAQAIAELNISDKTTVNLNNASTIITTKLSGADSVLNIAADKTLTGAVSFAADATVNVANNGTVTGDISSDSANQGVLNFAGIGVVTGTIGAVNALKEINLNGAAAVTLSSATKAAVLTLNDAAAALVMNNDFTGEVRFTKNGNMTLDATKTITGNVATTENNSGILVLKDTSVVTGNIGTKDAALRSVTVDTNAAAVLSAAKGTTHYSKEFTFDNAASELQLTNATTLVGNLVANANGNGVVTFNGDGANEIKGLIGSTNGGVRALVAVVTNGAGTVKINSGDHQVATFEAAHAKAGFIFADGANITGAIHNTSNGVNSTAVTFEGSSTVTGEVGTAYAFKDVNFNGGTVTIGGVAQATNMNFKGEKATTLVLTEAPLATANYVNTNGKDNIVELGVDTLLNGTLGLADAGKRVTFDLGTKDVTSILNAATAKADGAVFVNGSASNNKGALVLDQDNVKVYSAGSAAKSLKTVTFTDTGEITNGTDAERIIVYTGNKATFGGVVNSSKGLTLTNAGNASFLDGFTATTPIKGTVNAHGTVTFGQGYYTGNIGESGQSLLSVTLTKAKHVTLDTATIFANTITLPGEVTFAKDIAMTATVVVASSGTINLGTKTATINGGVLTFTGDKNKITTTLSSNNNVVSGGNIVIAKTASLSHLAGVKLELVINDSAVERVTGSTEFTVITDANSTVIAKGMTKADVTTTHAPTSLYEYSGEFTNGSLVVTMTDVAEQRLNEIGGTLDAEAKKNAASFANAKSGTVAADYLGKTISLLLTDSSKVKEVLHRATTPNTANAIDSSMQGAFNNFRSRMKDVSQGSAGIAAGDDHTKHGAWFSPFFSKTTQKARKGAAGYSDNTYGGSLGIDTKANDDLIVGAAVTFANSEMKHKDLKSGDKTKVNSLMFSIYGKQQITDTWFAQGSATVATNNVKNSRKVLLNLTDYETANSKYDSMSFVGDVMFGYNYLTQGFVVTPMAGMKYTRVNNAGYTETGSAANLTVAQKAANKFEVVVGAQLSGMSYDMNGGSVTPELHAFINHDIIGKTVKQDVRMGVTSLTPKLAKTVKTTYNLGLGVNADYGMMEYGVNYDLNMAEKRVGHEGSLKVRVNF